MEINGFFNAADDLILKSLLSYFLAQDIARFVDAIRQKLVVIKFSQAIKSELKEDLMVRIRMQAPTLPLLI